MLRSCVCLVLFLVIVARGAPAAAETTRFDVFAPNAAIAYDTLAAEYSIAIDFLTLQALNLKYGIGINISLCELQIKNTAPRQWSFFPVQIIFNPVNYDELLWVYLYAGAKLLFSPFDDARYDVGQAEHNKPQTRSAINPQFVASFSIIPYSAPKTMYRQHSVNVFLEYSTLNAFSVGISLPADGLSYLVNDWLDIFNAEFAPRSPSRAPNEPPAEEPSKTPREEQGDSGHGD